MCKVILVFLFSVAACSAIRDFYPFKVGQRSYTFHKALTTWSEARKRCDAVGAQLFMPKDRIEVTEVMNHVKDFRSTTIWIDSFVIYPEDSTDTNPDLEGVVFSPEARRLRSNCVLDLGDVIKRCIKRCIGIVTGPALLALPCDTAVNPFVCQF